MQLANKKTVAIMQPTYLPWVGYFDLIDQADLFIFLDSVQYARRSWQQRNRIRTSQGELMLTAPVVKGPRDQLLLDTKMDLNSDFLKKQLKTIQQNYKKAPFYNEVSPLLEAQFIDSTDSLVEFNMGMIQTLTAFLGLDAKFERASKLLNTQLHKVDLLIDLSRAVGATEYLSPPGSMDYIEEDNRFSEHHITLRYHQYQPTAYPQIHGPDFLPYMSIIDLLMNVGKVQGLTILRSGRTGDLNKKVLEAKDDHANT